MTTTGPAALLRRWLAAEVAADVATLAELATPDFRLVGPAGFVLDRAQWLDRFRPGALRITELTLTESDLREYDGFAVNIAVQTQTATYAEHDATGRFRTTHLFRVHDNAWRLTGQHLSNLGGRP